MVTAGLSLLSFILMIVENGLMEMSTPGWLVAKKLFAKGNNTNIALLGYSAIGLDFLSCFAILAGAYLLVTQHHSSRENGR